MIMYGLRDKKTQVLMSFDTSANDGDFCVSVEYRLSIYGDAPWLVYSREVAERACITDTPSYNATHDTPRNSYVGDVEVVEIELEIK